MTESGVNMASPTVRKIGGREFRPIVKSEIELQLLCSRIVHSYPLK